METIKNSKINIYVFSGWPYGTYSDFWDMVQAVTTRRVYFNAREKLAAKLQTGDVAFIRTYGEGIRAKGTITSLKENKGIIEVGMKNLEGLLKLLPQEEFFTYSSNQNKRSRIIQISPIDARNILDFDKRCENTFYDPNSRRDAAQQIEEGIALKENARYKTLTGNINFDWCFEYTRPL